MYQGSCFFSMLYLQNQGPRFVPKRASGSTAIVGERITVQRSFLFVLAANLMNSGRM